MNCSNRRETLLELAVPLRYRNKLFAELRPTLELRYRFIKTICENLVMRVRDNVREIRKEKKWKGTIRRSNVSILSIFSCIRRKGTFSSDILILYSYRLRSLLRMTGKRWGKKKLHGLAMWGSGIFFKRQYILFRKRETFTAD